MNPEFSSYYYQIDTAQCLDELINFIDTVKAVIPFRSYLKETGLNSSVLIDDLVSVDENFIFSDFFRILNLQQTVQIEYRRQILTYMFHKLNYRKENLDFYRFNLINDKIAFDENSEIVKQLNRCRSNISFIESHSSILISGSYLNGSIYYLFDTETESNVGLYYQYKSLIYRFSEMFPINSVDNLYKQKVAFILESPCELEYERKFKEFFKVSFFGR